MRRSQSLSLLSLAVVFAVASAGNAWADNFFTRTFRSTARSIARTNHWPEPFVFPDRDAVVRPFAKMIAKGLQVQNTLGEHHFQPNSNQLANAGLIKIRSILSDPAPHRRLIYVQRGKSLQETHSRIAATRAAAMMHLEPGAEAAVFPTSIVHRPWPAETSQTLYKDLQDNRIKPKLPKPTKDSGT